MYKFKVYDNSKQTVNLSLDNGIVNLVIEPAALKWTCDFKTEKEIIDVILDYSSRGYVCTVEKFN